MTTKLQGEGIDIEHFPSQLHSLDPNTPGWYILLCLCAQYIETDQSFHQEYQLTMTRWTKTHIFAPP
jgi:hypothetical protein